MKIRLEIKPSKTGEYCSENCAYEWCDRCELFSEDLTKTPAGTPLRVKECLTAEQEERERNEAILDAALKYTVMAVTNAGDAIDVAFSKLESLLK